MDDSIYFFKKEDGYFEFSNFYHDKQMIIIDGIPWQSSEHYYQAQKFINHPDYLDLIKNADTPNKSKIVACQKKATRFGASWLVNKEKYGQLTLNNAIEISLQNNVALRSDWEQVKIDVMKKAVFAKFSGNQNLKTLLLNTGNRNIYENSPFDDFWGIGRNKNGNNILGKILMETRNILRNNTLGLQHEQLPHQRCNYITNDKRILIGDAPTLETLNSIINSGVTLFIDFRDRPIMYQLPNNVKYINYPILNLKINKNDEFLQFRSFILNEYNKSNKIYLHYYNEDIINLINNFFSEYLII